MTRWIRVSLAAALLAALGLQAQVYQETASGNVDWQSKLIRAKGIGMPSAVGGRAGQIRVARADALRKILETVEGMNLTSETTVQDYMLQSDKITTQVRGLCRNFREVGEPTYLSDGSIELVVEMLVGQEMNKVLLGDMAFQEGTPTPIPAGGVDAANSIYTGLVVDCTGVDLRPAMAPRILSEDGSEIYGNTWVNREWALQNGMVGYVKSIEQAKQQQDRIGKRPLLVKATGVKGTQKADIVISDQEGKVLHSLSENLTFLSECRVLVVLK
jgi:hypothetical protein